MPTDSGLLELRRRYFELWCSLGRSDAQAFEAALADCYAPGLLWHGPDPFNDLTGMPALLEHFWRPLRHAFADLDRRDDVLLGDHFRDRPWITATGHFSGNFVHEWLGVPPNGKLVNLRFGEFCRVEAGRIVEVYVIIDWLDLMRQADCWPRLLPPAPGSPERIPGPATRDGILLDASDAAARLQSLRLVEAMIAGLMEYDGHDLSSMHQQDFWAPEFSWYGPAGIGSARGMRRYQQAHQQPFLTAFPDRVGGDHKARLACGDYVASTGWPSIRATHTGDGWLGTRATHRRITMRVMDFWRREGDKLAENWVFIDIPDLLKQFGLDVWKNDVWKK